jgi:hypothetical protein
MAGVAGPTEKLLIMEAVEDDVHVGTADRRVVHLHQHLIGPRSRDRKISDFDDTWSN